MLMLVQPMIRRSFAAEDTVTLQLKWYHQFQFAGYYAALEKGFYRDVGLDVNLLEGGPFNIADSVLSSRAKYGVSTADVVLQKLQGKPIVLLGVIFQHSPHAFLVREGSDIEHPQDLIGRRVWMTMATRSAELQAILVDEGVALDRVKMVGDVADSYDFLFDDAISAIGVYITNEPYYLEQQGIPYSILLPRTYGIDFYGDSLFTTEAEIKSHPDRVRRFREASLKGWEYAMAHPEEIVDLILTKYRSRKTRAHLQYEAKKMRDLILPDLVKIGHINPGRWRHIADTYVRLGMAKPDYSLEGFIYDPHPAPNYTWFYRLLGIAGLLLGISVLALGTLSVFNARLRRIVKVRTSELVQRNEALNQEIETRKESEKQIRFQARLLGAVGQAVIATDSEGIVMYANDAAETLYGWPVDEMIGRNIMEVTVPQTTMAQGREIMDQLMSGKVWSGEFLVQRRDGTAFPAYVTDTPIKDEKGDLVAIIGVSMDITEMKQAEAAVRESEEKYRILFQSFPGGITVSDASGQIMETNAFSEEILGVAKPVLEERHIGGSEWEIVRLDGTILPPEAYASVRALKENKLIENIEMGIRKPDGKITWLNVTATPIPLKNYGVLVTYADITDRKNAELALKEALAEKVVLLREIHHRVKNNMQVIIGLLRMHSRRNQDPHLKNVFDDCRDRVEAMSLIHEALYQSEDLSKIDFEAYLKQLCRNLGLAHDARRKGITLTSSAADVSLNMDQGVAVGMIVAELISNTFKHAFPHNEGGAVSVHLDRPDGETVRLVVSDTGIGLPEDFDIQKPPSLGMRLVAGAVTRELGGALAVESAGGTRFIIRFPHKDR
jgi:PAS domain S-box-containing protein